ncbi:MAG: thiopurine S-methyltransferase [Alphaproteobacteria bacterium]|nr:MAG: thiopurine S-methyltransferase [Alphaproteobacteria bacterium]
MEKSFWLQRWADNDISFHGSVANPMLLAHLDILSLSPGARVFVPLCGKTLDIGWLLGQGFRVVGAELSEIAIEQLFQELGTEPAVCSVGPFKHYSAPDIDIFVGNIFDLDAATLGPVDAVYDRAALVALPAEMRQRYSAHLVAISGAAPQLMICYEYDQSALNGPPFAVPRTEVHGHYDASHAAMLLAEHPVEGGLKGRCPATELVWHLARR